MQVPNFVSDLTYGDAVRHIVIVEGHDVTSIEELRNRVQDLLIKTAIKVIRQSKSEWVIRYNRNLHQQRLNNGAYFPSYGTVMQLRARLTAGMDRRKYGKGRAGVASTSRYNYGTLRKAA